MEFDIALLKRLLAANEQTGEKTQAEVIDAFVRGCAALDKMEEQQGKNDVISAIEKINLDDKPVEKVIEQLEKVIRLNSSHNKD